MDRSKNQNPSGSRWSHQKPDHNPFFSKSSSYEPLKKRSFHRRRESSSSSSSSSRSSSRPRRVEDLYADLRVALEKSDMKEVYLLVKDISRMMKEELGILRVSIANTFGFNKSDIEEFFGRFGRIQSVIIKESKINKEQTSAPQGKEAEGNVSTFENGTAANENVVYIIYSQYFSAVVAMKVVNSVNEKDRIAKAKVCVTDDSIVEEDICNPMIGDFDDAQFMLEIEKDMPQPPLIQAPSDVVVYGEEPPSNAELMEAAKDYRYFGTIGLDLEDKTFCLRERITGVKGCNFLRIYYLCEKAVRFENEVQENFGSGTAGGDPNSAVAKRKKFQHDLQLKLVWYKQANVHRDVAVFANNLSKYNTAIRYLHELLEQIVEEYKNSREKSCQIIPKDVHIRRWEKFKGEPTLKFLEPKPNEVVGSGGAAGSAKMG